jgi:hypothetical protein
VPIDLGASFWTPSGSQVRPTQGGFDALGPAIVVVPGAALPTGEPCGLAFSPEVVDKDGNRLCAPPEGDRARGCVPGDSSAIAFTVEPLGFTVATVIKDPGQSRTDSIFVKAVAPIDPATIAGIAVTEGAATPYPSFLVALSTPDVLAIQWTAAGGLAANTRYTIVIPTTVTDAYHKPAPQPFQVAFTTGAM